MLHEIDQIISRDRLCVSVHFREFYLARESINFGENALYTGEAYKEKQLIRFKGEI